MQALKKLSGSNKVT